MKTVADSNIPYVAEGFATFGEVVSVPAAKITAALVADASILLVRSRTVVDKNLLAGSAVKFVGSATIGVDHIDQAWLASQGIAFAHAAGSNADSVCQYVVTAILNIACEKKIDLSQKTLGIIGAGNIGARLYRAAAALGLRCLLNDPPKQQSTGHSYYRPLEEVLRLSDIISLHVPLTQNGSWPTARLINKEFIARCKTGAILINTSRGAVADEEALIAGADKFAALILDVWDNEPDISLALLDAAALATPHIAGYSLEGKKNGLVQIYEAACAFFFKQATELRLLTDEQKGVQTIAIDTGDNVLQKAVTGAFPIRDDDARLRKIAQKPPEKRGAYFEKLRAEYPVRREFSHFRIVGPRAVIDQFSSRFAALGFRETVGE